MLKAWSITTTVRNPERLRDFLITLQPLVGKIWNKESQELYQKLLIKNRLYGYGSRQFYSGLDKRTIDLISDVDKEIDDALLDHIVISKNYRDFDMRGRQSLNPLTKFGFAYIDKGILKITELGQDLIFSEGDLGDAFLKSFIKWQIPNPASRDFPDNGDYDINPFVGTLKLINEVNELELKRGCKAVGLKKREFSLFAPTLLKHTDIEKCAGEIIKFRDMQKDKTKTERKNIRDEYRHIFASNFLNTQDEKKIDKFLKNLGDYGDNAIRYFRLTKFIRIRGGGFYIDLEPSRKIEIKSLFDSKFYMPRKFASKVDYQNYMSNSSLPKFPWETIEKLLEIIINIHKEINILRENMGMVSCEIEQMDNLSDKELSLVIIKLRKERQQFQEKHNHIKARPPEALTEYIGHLENIYSSENRALMLEYISTMGLHALNDARTIKPNYPVGDDNEPTSTAPGGVADIECYYEDFNMICEVTMLNGRDQWFNEGQPVMRHLREFENINNNSYCLFIAPTIHTDSAETFWNANTIGYKGCKQKIAPITIKQFVSILTTLKKLRELNRIFTHNNLEKLVNSIVTSTDNSDNSDLWVENIDNIVKHWSISLVKDSSNN